MQMPPHGELRNMCRYQLMYLQDWTVDRGTAMRCKMGMLEFGIVETCDLALHQIVDIFVFVFKRIIFSFLSDFSNGKENN